MACDITKGRGLACKNQRTGIKYVMFVPFEEFGFSVTGQEIATLPTGLTEVFKYDIKGTANKFDDVATVNLENRTVEYKQTLALSLQRMGKETEVELMALLYGRVVAFIFYYNGKVKVAGIDSGLDGTTAANSSDTSGYTITLEAQDNAYAPYLSASAITALGALVSTDIIAQ